MSMRTTMVLALVGVGLATISHALSWVGNTRMSQSGGTLPLRGSFLEPWQQLDIVTETWPINTGQRVVAVVTTNNFQTSQEYEFSWQANVNNNSRWTLRLPTFSQGAQVQFYIRATRLGQPNAIFDNQSGNNFAYQQRWRPNYSEGAILQWFATDYKTILRRLPEVVEAGYSAIYLPGPTKSGVGGFSAGYDPVDRFDLGDRLQKGTVRTNFGTTQELIELVRTAKRFGLEVYCDLLTNHNANRANHPINQYPDMIPEDFHIRASTNTGNNEINFNTESAFSFGMLNHELVGLVDIAHEDGNNTQTGAFNLPSYANFNPWGKPSFIRNATVPQLYPNNTPVAEDVRELLDRWVRWLSGTIGFDGFRIDAVKHTPPGYFGWAPDQAASQSFTKGNLIPRTYSVFPNTFFFGEVYSSNSYELREYAKTGMNLLDFPLFFNLKSFFNANGFQDIGAALGNGYSSDPATGLFFQQAGLSPDVGVAFVQSHDDGPPTSNNLAHAFILGRPGRAKIYYDGNNIQPGNWTNFPRPGRFDALGNGSDTLTKLVEAHSRFARGFYTNRWQNANVYAFERRVNGRGTMLVALNDRGDNVSETITVQTSFAPGTVLVDYSGQRPNVTVNGSAQVTITIPPNFSATEANNGRGYVFYAPQTPEPLPGIEPVTLIESVNGRPTTVPYITYSNPSGTFSSPRSFRAATVREDRLSLRVRTNGLGNTAFIRVNQGLPLGNLVPLENTGEGLTDGFVPLTKSANGDFSLTNLDISSLSDGLHLIKVRVFADTGTDPGMYTDFNTWVYVQRGLRTNIQVDGNLADLGPVTVNQTRTPSSNTNRIDGLNILNDDRFLYIGLPGRTDPFEGLTNGMAMVLDVDGAPGVRDLSQINDDSGPAARLISNTRLTMPLGFGADFAVGIFRNASQTSAPEAPFAGGLTLPVPIGASAGAFRVQSSNLQVLNPISSVIATQIRVNRADPTRGAEIAIPLSALYSNGAQQGDGLNLVAWLGTTGEKNTFLPSTDPTRAALGGRPAPESFITNQFIPVQSAISGDPGTGAVTLSSSYRHTLQFAALANPTQAIVTPSTVVYDAARGVYIQNVEVRNASAVPLFGPIALRVATPSSVVLTNRTGMSLVYPTRGYMLNSIGQLQPNTSIRYRLEFTAPNAGAVTPTFEVLTTRGIL